jgi:hypothetical protein
VTIDADHKDEHSRIWKRFSESNDRLRASEEMRAPRQQEFILDFRNLEKRVEYMDVHGTAISSLKLKNIEDDVREIKEDQKATRNFVKSALITATLSIAVQLIVGIVLFVVLRGT